jgi:hypothetical protein
LEISDLKSILQHSKANKNFEGILYVYPSRYRKILSDYYSLNAIEIEGMLDNYALNTDYYILSKLDDNGNSYKVIKDKGIKEIKGKCENCDCGKKRMLNPISGRCYYKESIETNYTTKI